MAALNVQKKRNNFNEEKKLQGISRSLISIFTRDFKLIKKRITDKNKESFYLELSTLIGAGLDLKSSLELLIAQQQNNWLKNELSIVKDRVIEGLNLSIALNETGYFTPYEFHSLRIGEETSRIPEVLKDLAGFFSRKIKQRRQIIQALSYPVVVLLTSIGAVAFMLNFVVPMFSEVFKRFGSDLPAITKFIISLSSLAKDYLLIGVGISLIGLLILRFVNQSIYYKRVSSKVMLNIPFLGKIVHQIYLSQLCNSFALLINSKVTLIQTVILVREMIEFYPINISLLTVEKDLYAGVPLYESFKKSSFYDPKMLALIKVGEEVNKLDYFFYQLAKQYNEEVEYRTSLLNSVLEPIIIVVLGLMVGVILIAMYLPLFQLSNSI